MASAEQGGRVWRLFGLSARDGARVAPSALFHLSFVAGVAVLKSAANALVVSRFEATALPLLYIAAAVVTSVATGLDGAFRRSTEPPRHSMALAGGLTAMLAACSHLGFAWAAAGLYLVAEAYATVASVRFWASLGEQFDPRESKRLFGVIGGFGMAGSIVGGLFSTTLGGVFGASLSIGFTVVTQLACGFLGPAMVRAAQRTRKPISSVDVPVAGSGPKRVIYPRGEAVTYLRSDPYPRAVALLSALLAILSVTADYLFRISAKGAYDEAELAALFGGINLAMGVAAMVFQLFFSARVLSRFGIFRYLGLTPVGLIACAVLCGLMPGVGSAFGLKVVEAVGSLSISPTGMQLLYGPLPDGVRVPARALIDGLVKKTGAATGGFLLLVLASFVKAPGLALAVAVLSAGVLMLLSELKRLYVRTIDARLAGARWAESIALDAEARGILLKALADPEPARALLAADLLAHNDPLHFRPWVRTLLTHPNERVRTRGVKLAAELAIRELVPKLRTMAASDERRPRDEAVFALAALDVEAPKILGPLLDAADVGLRASAVAALLRFELSNDIADGPAATRLKAMLERKDAPAPDRRELARLLGRLAGTPFVKHLDPLLDDPDVTVQRLAVASAGECRRIEVAPKLLRMVSHRELRRTAREALSSMGDAVADLLEDALNDKSLPVAVRYEIPRLLRYLGSQRAAQILLYSNIEDDPFLRYRIGTALSRMRRADPNLAFDTGRVGEAIGRRVEAYRYYLPIYRDLVKALPPGAMLLRGIEDRLAQNVEIVFLLLGLVYPHKSMMNVFHRFASGEARDRAYAVELFDNIVDEGLRERILPLLEDHHRMPSDSGDVQNAPARLMELIVSKDVVLRACAIATARRMSEEAEALRIPEEGAMSESVVQKVFLLEGVDIFSNCSVDDLAALAAIATEKRYPGQSFIYRENDPGDTLMVIVEGEVRIEKAGQQVLHLKNKDSFGETSLLDGSPRPADARALMPVRVLSIDRQDFVDLVSDRPELLKGLFGAVTRHLRLVLEVAAAGRLSAPKGEEARPSVVVSRAG